MCVCVIVVVGGGGAAAAAAAAVFTTRAIWAATRHLQRIYLHLWRMKKELVMAEDRIAST